MAITLTELKTSRSDIEMTILGMEATLVNIADRDSDEAIKLLGRIGALRNDITELDKQIGKIEQKEEQEIKRDRWKKEKPTIDSIIKQNNIGYIIPEGKYIYCRDFGTQGVNNVMFEMVPATAITKTLSKMAGFNIGSRDYNEITDYFQEVGRTYLKITSSFNTLKWKEDEIYNKMSIVRSMWLQPDYENADDYSEALDVLIYCMCGGKQENIDHFERWVAFKYLNPDKNANIPNLDLGGNPGGNGKGTTIQLLKTIFGPMCVVQAHKEELEKFNAAWEMAVILYYDEPEEKELAVGKLKQATGSEDMRVEKKGIDATMADRNYNFIFMSNNSQGVVKLSGGSSSGEDRRYSVINTNLVLVDEVAGKLGHDLALTWVNDLAQKVVKDRVTVAKWLAHIIRKHKVEDINILPALHGADYLERFETQKDAITEAFDRIIPVLTLQGFIPKGLLCDVVRAITSQHNLKDPAIVTKFSDYCRRNKLHTEKFEREHYKTLWEGSVDEDLQRAIIVYKNSVNRRFELSAVMASRPANTSLLGVSTLPLVADKLVI